MKIRYWLAFLALSYGYLGWTQSIEDVLRYSVTDISGSARYKAMGGAFGALGGDLSSLNVNPAGSAVFNSSQFAITGFYSSVLNESGYGFGNAALESRDDDIDLNQIGGVLVQRVNGGRGITKLVFGLNYEETRNFDNQYDATGQTTSGLDTYFLGYAQGVPLSALERQSDFIENDYLDIGEFQGFGDQQAFLGLAGGFIRPADPGNPSGTAYQSNASYSQVRQLISVFSQGEIAKFTMNSAIEINNRFYLGASLNGHWITRGQTTLITEEGYAPGSPIGPESETIFDNRIDAEGTGFSAQVGFIAKVAKALRLGASYQSPTWYWIRESTSQRVNSPLADPDINFINFNVVNIYPEYRMRTPAQTTLSGALVLGKSALFSADFIYRDYSTSQLGSNNEAIFQGENRFIEDFLGAAWEYRFGHEFRAGDAVSFRAGYRRVEGPFEGSDEGLVQEVSGGVGVRINRNSRLDLAISSSNVTTNVFPIEIGYPDNFIEQERTLTQVSLSYIVNF